MKQTLFPTQLAIGFCLSLTFAGAVSAQDFTVSANPSDLGSLSPGRRVSAIITTTVSGGFNGDISLTAVPATLPYGTVKFRPSLIAKPGAGSSNMYLHLAAPSSSGEIPPGVYTILVVASSGPSSAKITHTATVSFRVGGIAYTVSGKLGPVISGKDPLAFNGVTFNAQTGLRPLDQPNSPSNPASYTPVGALVISTGPVALDCTGATVAIAVSSSSVNGGDTFNLSNCTLAGLAPFTVSLALPASAYLSTTPLPFPEVQVDSQNNASQASYTISGQTTVLGITGTMTAACVPGIGFCTDLRTSPHFLTFSATAGGSAPPTQQLGLITSGRQTSVFVNASTRSGGDWLTVTSDFAQTGGSIGVNVAPGNLAAGTYHGLLTIYGGGKNSPKKVPVKFTVTP